VIANLCEGVMPENNIYFKTNASDKDLVIIITTDRGLCGSLNVRTLKMALSDFNSKNTDYICVGKKGCDILGHTGANTIASFVGIMNDLKFRDVLPLVRLVIDEYKSEKYRSVSIVYPKFISTLNQEATTFRLLPFSNVEKPTQGDVIIFEPSKETMLNELIEKVIESKIWQIILESAASEHSARMIAMKNANENAEELIDDLTLTFNQSRQAAITSELAEISAGKMALEN
jgi:F-type H+-transporting ATPase subunit gamma